MVIIAVLAFIAGAAVASLAAYLMWPAEPLECGDYNIADEYTEAAQHALDLAEQHDLACARLLYLSQQLDAKK